MHGFDRPTKRPYARIERERRFLLDRLPPGVSPDDYERIDDLFIEGTHLRLRVVRRPTGEWLATKLGQKVVAPDAPDDPRQRQMTTIYLPEGEGAVLASLPGLRAMKRRHRLCEQGLTFAVDVWESPVGARGVILAEVEAASLEELDRVTLPTWAHREVTHEPELSAIALARS